MKTIFILIGVCVTLCCAGVGGFLFFAGNAYRGATAEAQSFGNASLTSIASKWDMKELTSRAAPQLLQGMSQEQLAAKMKEMSSLGPVVSIDSQVTSIEANTNGGGTTVRAPYHANVKFKNGERDITMDLVKHGQTWEIASFDSVK